ncbi:hypothetical protein BLOT_009122 [Blomia tropicalis]|nr:hypothetical protein BLOT_009122 [Blomia tropicalis]
MIFNRSSNTTFNLVKLAIASFDAHDSNSGFGQMGRQMSMSRQQRGPGGPKGPSGGPKGGSPGGKEGQGGSKGGEKGESDE